jgi:hypothetical protein
MKFRPLHDRPTKGVRVARAERVIKLQERAIASSKDSRGDDFGKRSVAYATFSDTGFRRISLKK